MQDRPGLGPTVKTLKAGAHEWTGHPLQTASHVALQGSTERIGLSKRHGILDILGGLTRDTPANGFFSMINWKNKSRDCILESW